jgi:hypothetical protein
VVDELACRPGSVPAHLTVLRSATIHLGLPLPTASCGLPASSDGPSSNARAGLRRARTRRLPSWPCSGWGLPSRSGRPERWWSLTPPFHPYRPVRDGGLFSVALSRGSPRVGVTHHPALRSPDLPRGITPSRPPGQLIHDQPSRPAASSGRRDAAPGTGTVRERSTSVARPAGGRVRGVAEGPTEEDSQERSRGTVLPVGLGNDGATQQRSHAQHHETHLAR